MVSPKEQALFLEQLITGRLDIGGGTLEALREVSLLGDFSGYRLHGKTGSGPVIEDGTRFQTFEDFDGDFEGWLVGWVERPQSKGVVYALHVRGSSYAAIDSFRGQMSAQFLRVLKALPDP
jgi:beta-lactamase class D